MENYAFPLSFTGKKVNLKMETYENWKSVELLQLLQILVEEECPTGHLSRKVDEIVEITAKKLDVEPKEVVWIVRKKRNRSEKRREEEEEKEQEESFECENRHTQLAGELKTINSTICRQEKHVEKIFLLTKEIEKAVTSLNFSDLGKDIPDGK